MINLFFCQDLYDGIAINPILLYGSMKLFIAGASVGAGYFRARTSFFLHARYG